MKDDGLGIFLRANHEELVAQAELSVLVGDDDMAFVAQARADERTAQELLHLEQAFAVNGLVAHLQRHHVRLLLLLILVLGQLRLFLGEVHAEDVADGDDGADDAQHAQRVSAGIAQGDGVARVVQLVQRLLCGAKTGSVGHCAIEDAHHHGQVHTAVGNEVNGEGHGDVEHNDQHRKQVQRHAALLEGREERRTYLKADAEHEQRQTELTQEMQDGRGNGEAEVPHQDAHEEHEGHAQRDARHLDFAQHDAYRYHERIEQHDMGYGGRVPK